MSFRKIKNERKLCVILCTPARCVVMCVMVYFELQLANREKKEGTSRRRGLNFRGKFMPPPFPAHICECGAYRGSTYNKSRGERRKDSGTILCVKKCLYVVGTHVRIGGLGSTTSPGGRPGAKKHFSFIGDLWLDPFKRFFASK